MKVKDDISSDIRQQLEEIEQFPWLSDLVLEDNILRFTMAEAECRLWDARKEEFRDVSLLVGPFDVMIDFDAADRLTCHDYDCVLLYSDVCAVSQHNFRFKINRESEVPIPARSETQVWARQSHPHIWGTPNGSWMTCWGYDPNQILYLQALVHNRQIFELVMTIRHFVQQGDSSFLSEKEYKKNAGEVIPINRLLLG